MSESEKRKRYWKTNLKYLASLLSIWFLVSYGCAILFVDFLDQFQIAVFH